MLSCTATTPDLPITFTWTDPMGNEVTPLSGSATSSNISITTSTSSDYGTYTCVASNRFGSVNDTVTLIQAGKFCIIKPFLIPFSLPHLFILIPMVLISSKFDIHYTVAPTVSLGGQDLMQSPEVLAGSTLELSVNIASFNLPLTSITWTHNGNVLTSGQDRVTITNPSLSDPAPVVSITRASLIPLDSGNYSIMATNPEGSSTYTFQVTVSGMLV